MANYVKKRPRKADWSTKKILNVNSSQRYGHAQSLEADEEFETGSLLGLACLLVNHRCSTAIATRIVRCRLKPNVNNWMATVLWCGLRGAENGLGQGLSCTKSRVQLLTPRKPPFWFMDRDQSAGHLIDGYLKIYGGSSARRVVVMMGLRRCKLKQEIPKMFEDWPAP